MANIFKLNTYEIEKELQEIYDKNYGEDSTLFVKVDLQIKSIGLDSLNIYTGTSESKIDNLFKDGEPNVHIKIDNDGNIFIGDKNLNPINISIGYKELEFYQIIFNLADSIRQNTVEVEL